MATYFSNLWWFFKRFIVHGVLAKTCIPTLPIECFFDCEDDGSIKGEPADE
jgi:hypothetical protein